jgi:hypothetical protein
MITYKGFTIQERVTFEGVKVYDALRNKNHAIASLQSLAEIVEKIDKEVGKTNGYVG